MALRHLGWLLILAMLPATGFDQDGDSPAPLETLQYSVEWRFVRAGTARLSRTPASGSGWRSDLHLESGGLVNKLYRVNDDYWTRYDGGFCVANTHMKAEEGKRRRETNVTFDGEKKKSSYIERDTIKNTVVLERQLDVPACVHDVIAALQRLRAQKMQPGQNTEFPISDGKRMVMARIEAQEKESVKTPAGTFQTIRYEAFLFNDVLYHRKGRLFVWITDDDRRTPVQVRARLNFPVGTISLQLEKILQ